MTGPELIQSSLFDAKNQLPDRLKGFEKPTDGINLTDEELRALIHLLKLKNPGIGEFSGETDVVQRGLDAIKKLQHIIDQLEDPELVIDISWLQQADRQFPENTWRFFSLLNEDERFTQVTAATLQEILDNLKESLTRK